MKNRVKHRRVVAWAWVGALLGLLPLASIAHEEKDPVCGMAVEIEKAFDKSPYAGKTYFFCSDTCLQTFRGNPDKYVSALRLIEFRGKVAVALTVRPRMPKPGDLAKFYLQAGRPPEGEMAPDPKTALRLAEGHAYLYPGDRGSRAEPEIFRLHETEEAGTYGFSKLIAKDGVYRAFFVVRYQSGEEIRIGFDCTTEGATPKDDHHDLDQGKPPAPAVAKQEEKHGTDHGSMDPGAGKLSMEAQHETMRKMGEDWTALQEMLFVDRPDFSASQSKLDDLRRWMKNMPGFMLHKFADRKAEFAKYAGELDQELGALDRAIREKKADDARARFVLTDGRSCVKCHLKFRWGVVEDLSRFPDLRRVEHAADRK